jgi:hypothetical protein
MLPNIVPQPERVRPSMTTVANAGSWADLTIDWLSWCRQVGLARWKLRACQRRAVRLAANEYIYHSDD